MIALCKCFWNGSTESSIPYIQHMKSAKISHALWKNGGIFPVKGGIFPVKLLFDREINLI